LDTTEAWTRIELLLTQSEKDVHSDALSDRDFFLNSALLAFVVGFLVTVGRLSGSDLDRGLVFGVALLGASYVFYRAAVEATIRWGRRFIASVDLHRADLYRALGIRSPSSFSEERNELTWAVNRFLLEGEPIPDQYHSSRAITASE
jgi:hypothetical protein